MENLRGVLLSVSGTMGVIHRASRRSRIIPGLVVKFKVSRVRTRCITRVGLHRLGHRCVLGHAGSLRSLRGRVTRLSRVLGDGTEVGAVVIGRLGSVTRGCNRPEGDVVVCSSITECRRRAIRVPSCPIGLFFAGRKCFGGVAPRSLEVDNRRGLGSNSRVVRRLRFAGGYSLLFFASGYRICGTGTSSFTRAGTDILNSCITTGLNFSRNRGTIGVIIAGSCGNVLLFTFRGNGTTGIPLRSCTAGAGHGGLANTCSSGSPLIKLLCVPRSRRMLFGTSSKGVLLIRANTLTLGAAHSARNITILGPGGNRELFDVRHCGSNAFAGPGHCEANSLPTENTLPIGSSSGSRRLSLV